MTEQTDFSNPALHRPERGSRPRAEEVAAISTCLHEDGEHHEHRVGVRVRNFTGRNRGSAWTSSNPPRFATDATRPFVRLVENQLRARDL